MAEKVNGLYAKISRIMGKLERLPKTGTNDHFKYAFVTDADVADAVRRELANEGIAFFASMIDAVQEGKHTRAEFEFTFVCSDTGETKACKWFGEANDGQDKGLSKAATSAEKYFLLKTFMLSTGDKADDPDSEAGAPEQTQSRKTTSARHTDKSVVHEMQTDEEARKAGAWVLADDAKETLTRLRNKAAVYWGTDSEPMVYSHVYKRLLIIAGATEDQRSGVTSMPAFISTMRQVCMMSPADMWAGVENYPVEEQAA